MWCTFMSCTYQKEDILHVFCIGYEGSLCLLCPLVAYLGIACMKHTVSYDLICMSQKVLYVFDRLPLQMLLPYIKKVKEVFERAIGACITKNAYMLHIINWQHYLLLADVGSWWWYHQCIIWWRVRMSCWCCCHLLNRKLQMDYWEEVWPLLLLSPIVGQDYHHHNTKTSCCMHISP